MACVNAVRAIHAMDLRRAGPQRRGRRTDWAVHGAAFVPCTCTKLTEHVDLHGPPLLPADMAVVGAKTTPDPAAANFEPGNPFATAASDTRAPRQTACSAATEVGAV